jgi:hypothetical protein
VYVHPYAAVPRRTVVRVAPRVEEHRVIARSPREREAERVGRAQAEEHRKAEERKKKDKP